MVLLAHQDAALSRPESKAAALVTLERSCKTVDAGHKTASFDSGHVSARHGSRAGVRRATANDESSSSSNKNSSSFDDTPFIVSGPLLPIRQPRRGLNQNRNYRVIGTQSASSVEVRSNIKQSELVAAPPTPVSALALASTSTSTAGSSASQSSNVGEPVPGLASGSNRSSRSSKSTFTSISPTTKPVGVAYTSSSDARAGRIRDYDKHTYDVQELPMDSIVLSGHNSAASLVSSHRMSRSNGHLHSAAELEGRSGAVRVSSLLPGARASPAMSGRRLQAQYTSPSGSVVTTESGMFTQKYLVQRVTSRPSAEYEPRNLDVATHAASQIRISSPQIRRHTQQRSSSTPGPDTVEERSIRTHKAVANDDTPVYFADTEMDGRSSNATANPEDAVIPAALHATARDNAVYNATRQSWNMLSEDDIDGDIGARANDRQRRRRGIRGAVTTEKFYVRPVSILEGHKFVEGARPLTASTESPVDVPYIPGSPASEALSVKSLHTGFADAFYALSSADEYTMAAADYVRFPDHTQISAPKRMSRLSQRPSGIPGLDQRATSFDLGRIRPHDTGSNYINEKGTSTLLHKSTHFQGSASLLRSRTHSSDRVATLAVAKSAQTERIEEGYDGDSEGLVNGGARIPVHRRNTVAGDKIDDSPELDQRPARLRMPRNTSDFSDLVYNKEGRRTMRGSRRRSNTQVLQPIGTLILPGHSNYVLMFNMLTGIRVSVSRCEAKDRRPVRADDYSTMRKYSFDVVGDEMTSSSRYDFKFKDYAPWVFRCIREAFHLSTEDYLMSLTDKYILSEVGSSGKSGSFFYYSQDYRFIIKTVHHTEHKFMRQVLPQYYEFVRDNPHTLLSRIYGLHRIKLPQGRKVHFIVMSNILPPNKDIHAQFDLKGSLQGRELSAELACKPRACMKDKNWVKMRQHLHLGPTKRHEFVKQLIKDVTLLIRLNIMDYSLLIGVHDLNKGNAAKLRDTTLAMFDPRTTDIQQLNRLTRAHTIRKKVVHTDPVALDALPQGTLPPLPESMFQELRYSMFYREDGGILSSDQNDNPAQLIYYLGVIDILTPYNMIKRTEHVVKSMVHDGSQISAINPRKYGLRFLHFMIRSLDGYEDVLPLLDAFERTTYQEICREHRLF
ncbi:Phosphatidylinositol-4-phosphate 5-kinase [Coemansia sp. RSA 1822]|nr:Phosphatidylinositol-4-phosphate 5-kinase [Coemansia sp. RSA 1822]